MEENQTAGSGAHSHPVSAHEARLIAGGPSAERGNTWAWGSAPWLALAERARELGAAHAEAFAHHADVVAAVAAHGFGGRFAPEISARALDRAFRQWQGALHDLRVADGSRTRPAAMPRTRLAARR